MDESAGEWGPLLDGDLAHAATLALDAIGRDLRALTPVADPCLTGGTAGWALFHAYRAVARPDEGDDERAMELVSLALDAVAASAIDDSLFHGLAGVAWTVEHLGRLFYDLGETDPLVQIDSHLLAQVERTRRDQGFQLMTGLVGLGVYALERMPRPSARQTLSAIVRALEDSATTDEHGVTWFTSPEHLGADLAMAPDGYFNLGLAHGVPGALAFLARCAAAGIEVDRAQRLRDGAAAWLLAQRRPAGDEPNRFPAFILRDGPRSPVHAGWCYGDPGVACALALAGQTAAARAIALEAAARPFDALGLDDGGLCHGACGTGHMFHRLYRATGELAIAAAARTCFSRALAMRTPEGGVGGFRELDVTAPGGRRDSPDLLGGAAGIGLALLAAVSDQAPSWDTVFLIGAP